ncbi:MAG TPA: VOC family protein [Acidimicrobiia bacterium]|nr:VOC family protein [Acidimicrobiia bacterium]
MTQRIFPMLAYRDAPAALEFLTTAFGFEETMRMEGENGTIAHAELEMGGQRLMLASAWRDAGMAPPIELAGIASQLMVQVDDVDAHFRRALEAGATVIDQPADQEYGERTYRATDPEGHRWIFGSPIS